ncbi:hypothetical protein ACF09Y_21945 [Streptomyces massasporeus]|uniref:hypothetical protein n=1 Tax=Streptomyces massasporeus TaxID=67324 RepID=UPI0036FC8CF7
MPEQVAARWTRRTWDQYVEQVGDSISEPEISVLTLERTWAPRLTIVCPFCLRMQSEMTVVQAEGGESFTVTWRECQHAVSVEGPGVVSGGA